MKQTLIFDMDGVLVEVSGSYREAIIATVEHFTGRRLSFPEIQLWKNKGGFNNDWVLSHRLIEEFGSQIPYENVVDVFQQIYLGKNHDGLLLKESWLAAEGVLERLATAYGLALFTGRLREEALFALRRFAPDLVFDPIVSMDDVASQKPDPEGLYQIRATAGPSIAAYVGDTGDDLRAANAAGIPFIGVVAPELPHRNEVCKQFQSMGAAAIIPDVNALEEALCRV